MNINLKALCKQIKKDASRSLIWTVSNGTHYITNRHWMIKYRYNNMPREVLVQMFSAFAQIPEDGHSLILTRFNGLEIQDKPEISCELLFKSCEDFESNGVLTNIILDYGDFKCRVIKSKDTIIRLDETYMSMVDFDKDNARCAGRLQPISFCDNQLIILPFRTENETENNDILELLLVA